MGELDFHDTNLPWVLLLMILPLCLAIWLSLVLAALSLSEACLSCKPVCQYSRETIFFSRRNFGMEIIGTYSASAKVQAESRTILSPAVSWFLGSVGSAWVALWPGV